MASLGAVANDSIRSIKAIGFLPFGSPSNSYDLSLVEGFRRGLRDVGLVEDRDIVLDVVWISNEPEIPQAVSGLVERGAELLIPVGTSASTVVKRQVTKIPVLFINVGNPVGIGLVESLSRPGGNITGFSDMLADLSGKYVELARELGEPQATSTIFGILNGRTEKTGFSTANRQRNHLVSNFDHAGLATSPKRAM